MLPCLFYVWCSEVARILKSGESAGSPHPWSIGIIGLGNISAVIWSGANARGIPPELASPSTCVEVIISTVCAFRFGVAMRRITTLVRGLASVRVYSLDGRYGGEYAFACV